MTCHDVKLTSTNCVKYFWNSPIDVPAAQKLADTSITTNDNAVEIPVENPEILDDPSGIKIPFRWPVFTILVSVIQWAIFSFAMEGGHSSWVVETFAFYHNKRHQIWRLLTSLFLHFSKSHLWCNVISQLLVGLPLEIVHGWKRIAILYFCSDLIATLTEGNLEPLGNGMGASGAVYGLVGAHLSAVIMNWNEMSCPITRTILATIDIILSLLAPALMSTYFMDGENYRIAHAAHVGGAFGGLTLGVFVLKVFRKSEWKTKISSVCMYGAAAWVVFGLGANMGEQMSYWTISEELRRLQELAWNNCNENCTRVVL